MTMRKGAYTEKVFVLGVDGLDPRYSSKRLKEGKMPNLQKFIDAGSCREDLMLLGGHPTVTPPMWTTLACGCHSNVHGITAFYHQGSELDKVIPNFDSRNCKAEPIWNILAENDVKTCVFHWPGNAWPPTSDSKNLFVCDGSTPGGLGMGAASICNEFMVVADVKMEKVTYAPSATADLDRACVVKVDEEKENDNLSDRLRINKESTRMVLSHLDGMGAACLNDVLSIGLSPVQEPSKWECEVPEDAKEFIMLLSDGRIRRPALILKNENGIYDRVALYKSKKEAEPFVTLEKGIMKGQIYDEVVRPDGTRKDANYSMKIIGMPEDGSRVEIYISNAVDMHADYIFKPASLFYELAENVGYVPPSSAYGNHDPRIVTDCMLDVWNQQVDWQSDAIHYMIEKKGVQAIFSHMHNVDMQEHRFIRFMSEGDKGYQEKFGAKNVEMYQKFMNDVYDQTDRYLGKFLHLLDEGWTVIITSDHAQVCPPHEPPLIGEMTVNVRLMEELGYTYLKYDENGNELREIDWEKTTAIAVRECNIYINVKGRDKHTLPDGTVIDGLVDPADKYELEEKIMTDLYSYKDKKTGHRVIALALRNKDAVHLGYGGPDCGDICYWVAEGYNIDHCDGLSTTFGDCDTSLSPIFVAAGPGIKKGYKTDRIIRQIDVAPLISVLMNVRFPEQCEGAPVYQILDQAL